jgi:hypothetical protein
MSEEPRSVATATGILWRRVAWLVAGLILAYIGITYLLVPAIWSGFAPGTRRWTISRTSLAPAAAFPATSVFYMAVRIARLFSLYSTAEPEHPGSNHHSREDQP